MTSMIIEDMAALLVKVGECDCLPAELAGEVREMLKRMRDEGFYPDESHKRTNLDWLQWLDRVEKGSALEWLLGFCGHHGENGTCAEDCPYRHYGDECAAYSAGIDDLARWLFEEKKTKGEDKA